MLKDKNNQRLFRRVDIKIIFPPDILPVKHLTQRAAPRQGFNSNGIDEMLMHVADELDTLYPFWDFKMIPLAPSGRTASYVFTLAGYRLTPEATKALAETSRAQGKAVQLDTVAKVEA